MFSDGACPSVYCEYMFLLSVENKTVLSNEQAVCSQAESIGGAIRLGKTWEEEDRSELWGSHHVATGKIGPGKPRPYIHR